MGRLLVQQVQDVAGPPVELVLFVSDVFDTGARNAVPLTHELGQSVRVGQPDFASDDDLVRCGKSFAGDAGLGFLGQHCIKDSVRNPVADLVGVALAHALGGEHIVLAAHGKCSIKMTPPRQEAVVTVNRV